MPTSSSRSRKAPATSRWDFSGVLLPFLFSVPGLILLLIVIHLLFQLFVTIGVWLGLIPAAVETQEKQLELGRWGGDGGYIGSGGGSSWGSGSGGGGFSGGGGSFGGGGSSGSW